uniref:Uncharacterized protein n=1 Tax=Myoviridae sp. ctVeR24 TaxID=2827689 RepID=A0A8S5SYL6_9CAUD|nr:MAG TPA: hypothetical protein [Myoviridae sp. ctVeR24]
MYSSFFINPPTNLLFILFRFIHTHHFLNYSIKNC